MPKFFVDYTVTEVTRQRIVIEAESQEEAVRLIEEYEHDDLSESWQIDSMKYEIDFVEGMGSAGV